MSKHENSKGNKDNNEDEESKEACNEKENEAESEIIYDIDINSMIPPNVKDSFKYLTEQAEHLKSFSDLADSVQPIIEHINNVKKIYEPIQNLVSSLKEFTKPYISTDWKKLSALARKRLEKIRDLHLEFEEELWCIDLDALEYVSEDDITPEALKDYVHENLDEYVLEMKEEPMFSIHKNLLSETLEAYKNGYYKLCAFPLISTLEHIIASWHDGNIKNDAVHINPDGSGLYNKIRSLTKTSEERLLLVQMFAHSLFRVFIKLYKTNNQNLNDELNRHTIVHGSHDYDSINQIDILKLFQLLKACFILRHLEKEDFET